MTTNKYVNQWINEMAELTCPDKIVWIDGSDEQREALREEACSTSEIIKLNQDKLPGCYLHRTAINDVARVENRTLFVQKQKKKQDPSTTGWLPLKCMKSLQSSIAALTRAEQCTLSLIQWVL